MKKILTLIFSKNRAMQLEACMRSFVTHCYDFAITDVFIIYKATNESYGLAYDILAKEYSHKYEFKFLKENNFSQEVISLLSLYEYVLFLVDDNIFISNFYLTDCLELLDDTPNNLGFSLRLGLNINFCYPLNKTQQPPKFYYIFDNIIQFNWTEGEYDFGYPLEVSSSVYRTKDILKIIYDKEFHNPNTLESILAKNSKIYKVIKPFLFSFLTSAAFCNPTNIVNTTHKNRFGVDFHFAPENLNNKFLENLRIDLDVFNNFIPYACHQEVEFKFFKLIEPKKPLVSVIIPCYNQAVYLEDSLGSVINQTFKDWECIIINDGSTDQTNNKAMDLILTNLDKKILLLEKENGGLSSARNFGIRYSNGSFILPLDADDKIHHSFLEKTVNFLKNNPNFHFVYTDQQQFGKINKLIVTKEWNKREIAIFNFIAYCTLYIKEIWLNLGGYNPNMKYGYEDWDFWVGCAEQELIGKRLPEALFYYRVKSESMLTNAVKHDEKLKAQIIVNHPKIFTPLQMNWAITVLEGKGTSHYPTTTQQIIPQFFYYLDRPKKTSEFKILAIISTFNEEDIIECVLKDFNKNGIDVYIIDDGSTDSTVDIASKFLNINVINIEKFNSSSEKFEKGKYNWELILKRKEVLASLLEYDWFIHADADEFFESPWLNSTLKESIFFVDSLNYNAIYFKLYNFRPYNNEYKPYSDVRDILDYYEPEEHFDSLQIKAWKKQRKSIDLSTSGGHEIIFENRKIFPIPFIMRHYPIRSEFHGRKKVLRERIPRFKEEEKSKQWHIQYDLIIKENKFLWEKNQLIKWNPEQVRLGIFSKFAFSSLLINFLSDHNFQKINIIAQATKWIATLNDENEKLIKEIYEEIENLIPFILTQKTEEAAFSLTQNLNKHISEIFEKYLLIKYCYYFLSGNTPFANKIRDLMLNLHAKGLFTLPYIKLISYPFDFSKEVSNKSYPKEDIESLIQQKNFEKANNIISNFLNENPNNVQALNDLAIVEALRGNLDKSIEILKKGLKIDPDNQTIIENLRVLQDKLTFEKKNNENSIEKYLDIKPLISIIIPVHNNSNLTKDCINSIIQFTPQESPYSYEIIIIDNNSTDDTYKVIQELSSNFNFIKYIKLESNKPFGLACNLGADKAEGELLLFLNNDTIVKENWLKYLVDRLLSDVKIGIVGAKLLYPNGTIQHCGIDFFGGINPKTVIWPLHRYLNEKSELPEANIPEEVYGVTGACLLIKKELFKEVGCFDLSYQMYFEDLDLCFKVRKKGFKVYYEPKAEVIHLESQTIKDRRKIEELNNKSSEIFFKKWYNEICQIHFKKNIVYSDEKLTILSEKIYTESLLNYDFEQNLEKFTNEAVFFINMITLLDDNIYVHFGGAGDALLLLTTFYDDYPNSTVISFAHTISAMKSFFKAFPELKHTYLFPEPSFPPLHIILRNILRNSKSIKGFGITPSNSYEIEWSQDLDIFEKYKVKPNPKWIHKFKTDNKFKEFQVVIQPKGSLKGRAKGQENALNSTDWFKILDYLLSKGIEPIVIGVPDESKEYPCLNGCIDKRSYSFAEQMEIIANSDLLIGADSWAKTFASLLDIKSFVFNPMKSGKVDCSYNVFIRPWKNITLVNNFDELKPMLDYLFSK